uniref:Ig-like domain-containing protein n=1 Tax=Xenopus tropicalis TaxID=8364 RepID=A0A1B8Y122_XENTR
MMERYRHLHRIILMVVLQGGFPGSYSQDWAITLPESIRALRGSCVEIPCAFTLPRGNKDFRLVWYNLDSTPDEIIFSQQDPSDVSEGYRGRTSLVGNEPNSCSLRINDVRESDSYYPYIDWKCRVYNFARCQSVRVEVSDVPNKPAIQIPTDLTEGERAPISCSVEHTCPPRPPTLQWNRAGYKLTDRQQSLKDGVWKAETVMEYLPSYRDHGAELECEATYPNGLRSQRRVTLIITYKAQNVTIEGKDEVKEGAALELECHFSDYNPQTTQYSYSWYLNGNPVNGETGRILQINNITESHSGTYSCNVQNGVGPSYSPGFAVTLMSAQTGEKLPMWIILGGGAGSLLVILLVLALYVFLRKSQKLEASGGRRTETNIHGDGPNEGPENYYCNVSAIAGNGTAGTQMVEIELEDLYTEPKEPMEVEYTLVDHVPGKEDSQMQNPTDETEYSYVTC